MKKIHLSFLLLFILSISNIYAIQVDTLDLSKNKKDIELVTNQAYMFGAGSANVYDTYLSPLEYTGFSIHIFNERMRRTTWFDHKFYKQQVIQLAFASIESPTKNVTSYQLGLEYRLGGHYQVLDRNELKVGVGGLWNTYAGVLYNERNGNNPASAQVFTNLELSVMASYRFKKFAFRWQLDTPMIGMLFSPRYGQSYYEISLGNSVGIVNFASLHNQRALRNYFTVDIPISNFIVRAGYLGEYSQTKVNSLQTHNYTHSFVLGFPIEGIVKKKQKTKNTYWQ